MTFKVQLGKGGIHIFQHDISPFIDTEEFSQKK